MNILIATGIFPPDIGGPATYSKLLADELPKHGIMIDVLSFGAVRHLPKIIRHIAYFLKVLRLARGADIVFAQDPVSVGLPALAAAKLLRKRFLLKVVGDYAWEQQQVESRKSKVESGENGFVHLDEFQKKRFDVVTELRRSIQKFVAQSAEVIIVPSAYLKRIVGFWGIPEEKIRVVYNSFDTGSLGDGASMPSGGPTILSAGRLVPWKGFAALIEMMPQIREKITDVKLIIVGEGPERERLVRMVKERGLEMCVIFKGKLPHEELIRVLKTADIFVLNTAYEGFSHQILEAMASGTPVVTTNICGNPELIVSGKEGILISYNDKEELARSIIALLTDKKLSEELARNARQKAAQFSQERMIRETLAALL